jgi:hypothetical protein
MMPTPSDSVADQPPLPEQQKIGACHKGIAQLIVSLLEIRSLLVATSDPDWVTVSSVFQDFASIRDQIGDNWHDLRLFEGLRADAVWFSQQTFMSWHAAFAETFVGGARDRMLVWVGTTEDAETRYFASPEAIAWNHSDPLVNLTFPDGAVLSHDCRSRSAIWTRLRWLAVYQHYYFIPSMNDGVVWDHFSGTWLRDPIPCARERELLGKCLCHSGGWSALQHLNALADPNRLRCEFTQTRRERMETHAEWSKALSVKQCQKILEQSKNDIAKTLKAMVTQGGAKEENRQKWRLNLASLKSHQLRLYGEYASADKK